MDFKTNSLSSHIQSLLDNEKEFPQKLQQHLVFKSDQVTNPFKFISELLSKGILCDEPNDSTGNFGLKHMMVRLATRIAISKGAAGICGLMDALGESGNLQLVSDFRAWVKKNFGIETAYGFGEAKGERSAMLAPKAEAKPTRNVNQTSSCGTKLIDKITSRLEDDFMEQLQGHLVRKASAIVNVSQFCSSLVYQKVLDENHAQLKNGPEDQHDQEVEKMIMAACSKRAIGSLVFALQSSKNEHVLAETNEWLEKSSARKKNYPIAVKSLANLRIKEESQAVRSTFFEQAALSDELSKMAVFKCIPKSATKGTLGVQFDKEGMMACSADGTLNLWNLRGGEEKPINIAVKVKNITCFHYDDEILVLGTAEGSVHLFDMTTFEQKWSIRLGEPVHSLKFVESRLAAFTRVGNDYMFWLADISRKDMRLFNQRTEIHCPSSFNEIPGFCMSSDKLFQYQAGLAYVRDTKTGDYMKDYNKDLCFLKAPDFISALIVGDLVSSDTVVVAGCRNGMIAKWNTSKFTPDQKPNKTLQGHEEAIVSLCFLNGHLLSLDKSGKLLMWSGYDLENIFVTPAPRLLLENSNMTSLYSHKRWFATGSSEDDLIDVWTVPDLWLRTG